MAAAPSERPVLEVEMQQVDGEPVFVVPVDSLRQTFFRDLDASSKVNPNRRRLTGTAGVAEDSAALLYGAMRDVVLGADTREPSPALSASPGRPSVGFSAERAYSVEHSGVSPSRGRSISVPLNEGMRFNTEEFQHAEENRGRHVARATCAVATNVLAGSLVGAGLRRCSSFVASNIVGAFVLVQLLSVGGYAEIRWRDLVRDTVNLLWHGPYSPTSPSDPPVSTLRRYWRKLYVTLNATIPRRLSFWAGTVGGFVLLAN